MITEGERGLKFQNINYVICERPLVKFGSNLTGRLVGFIDDSVIPSTVRRLYRDTSSFFKNADMAEFQSITWITLSTSRGVSKGQLS